MADAITLSQCVLTWKIKNFLACHIACNDYISSPTFEVIDLVVKKWQLWLYPKGGSKQDDKIMVFLMRKEYDKYSEPVVLDVRIDVFNKGGCVLSSIKKRMFEIKRYYGGCLLTIEKLCQLMKRCDEDTLIIRCIIATNMKEKNDGMQSTEIRALTIFDVDRYTFKWDVSNTGCFDWSNNMSSPNTTMPDMKISLNAPDEAVQIKIHMLNASSTDELVMFKMKFLSFSSIELASICEKHVFESTDTWMIPTSICKKDLYYGNSSPPCYKYIFICECVVSQNVISSSILNLKFNSFVRNEVETLVDFPSSLLHDFRDLFINKKHSDVKLRINSNDVLAHKAVLTARSPVFSIMFDQDMLENQTGVVQIQDMKENTLQNLLEFIYTDTVREMDCESGLELLLAADKYQILNLTDKCTSLVLSLLSVENVCEVIVVADMINHASLKTFALNFIFQNASKVLSTPSWCLWVEKNTKLATEILCKLSEYIRREKID